MGRKGKEITLAVFLALACIPLFSQQKKKDGEDVVRLIQGKSVQIITDEQGRTFRKAVDATFLHNDTYLICDTAFWRVDENIINAKGHVQLIQDETALTSETLDYFVDDNLAQFRGNVVQLLDRENNTLRTRYLDYNTADSIAVFSKGASMKDKDGQIMESTNGTYDSKAHLFTFTNDVNMFTDSIFIHTSSMQYHTDIEKAVFDSYIDFWKDGNMLSASEGWYDRARETFFFQGKVHGTSENQETWSDSLYFYRNLNNVELRGNVQMQDSTHKTSALAQYMFYEDSLSMVTMRREAAVAIETEDNNKQIDTLFFGADTLIYWTVRRCDIAESEVRDAKTRLNDIQTDPVGEYRKKAAEEAAKKAAEAKAKKELSDRGGAVLPGGKQLGGTGAPKTPEKAPETPAKAPADSVKAAADSLAAVSDSLSTKADSLAATDPVAAVDSVETPRAMADSVAVADSVAKVEPLDTTKFGFAIGIGNVKIFRKDLQVRCDSMRYTDLDSIARFYKDPIIWNEGRRQYYSDSLSVLVRDGRADRASLMSNAFVVTQEDSLLYDQIKGAEIMAYFDSTSALKRFDALGGATAVFYLEENGKLATVNKVESRMLSGNFVNGDLDRIFYYDTPKNDAYPVVQFPKEDRYMKGFKWEPDKRPAGKEDITSLTVRPSERAKYAKHPKATFKQTDIYFPGYMKSVYASIDARKEAEREAARRKKAEDKVLASPDTLAAQDSTLAAAADSLAASDSLSVAADSTMAAVADSLAAVADSTLVQAADSVASVQKSAKELRKEKREARKKAREAKRKARIEAREARWAELDARDAAIEEAKRQKALEKKREKTRKALIAQQEQDRKDNEKLNEYIDYYRKKKAKEDGKNRR